MISLIVTALLGLFCCSSVNYNALGHTKEIETIQQPLIKNYFTMNTERYCGTADVMGLGFFNSMVENEYWSAFNDESHSVLATNNLPYFHKFQPTNIAQNIVGFFVCNSASNNNLSWIVSANAYVIEKTPRENQRFNVYKFYIGRATDNIIYVSPSDNNFSSVFTPYITFEYRVFYGIGGADNDYVLTTSNVTYNYNFNVDTNFLCFKFATPNSTTTSINQYFYDWLDGANTNNFTNEYNEYYTQGKLDGYNEGYEVGKQDGIDEAIDGGVLDPITLTIFTGILEVGLLPVNVFLQILNFEVFGINIAGFVSALLTISIVIIIVRFLLGGKKDD